MSIARTTTTIEAERVRLENYAVDAIARYGLTAQRHAAAALRLGHDPAQAARDVLAGNDQIGQAGIGETIARALVTAHLLGLRRTALAARQQYGHDVLTLSRAGDKMNDWTRRLIDLGAIAENEVVGLFARARAAAGRIVTRMIAPLMKRVDAVAETLARAGVEAAALPSLNLPVPDVGGYVPELPLYEPAAYRSSPPVPALPLYQPSMRQVVRELGEQFNRAGFVPGNEYGIANGLSGGMVRAYESGRARGWRMPAISEKLWGLHYSAVLDDRTTKICRGLDGTTLPKENEFWRTYTPPLHWNCRSCVIEVWSSTTLKEPPVESRNYEAFGPEFFMG